MKQILPHGFESFSITFWQTLGDTDLAKLAAEVQETLAGSGAIISSVSIFGNPLLDDEKAEETRKGWNQLIEAAHLFGCNIVTGFTGRVVEESIDHNIPRFVDVFEPLASHAQNHGVRLAFENCDMGGTWQRGPWNIAHTPDAWELMFNALPLDNIGLQWEPCHQMVKLIDPLPQLRKWVGKIFNVHGKDATVLWDVVREHGVTGPKQFAFHRTPGFGDSNWTDIISELRRGGFKGSIDIEGWHDPVYREELEMTGQVHGLNYLKQCRGGSYVPNPT
ncbi:MAG TPA: sugar phosphate isomerase/epimerase [Armatimonadota bacterium]